MAEDGLRWGAVVMIDALGFKGIWKRYNRDKVLKKMRGILACAEAPLEGWDTVAEAHCAVLSDTVVFAVEPSATIESPEACGVLAVALAALRARELIILALKHRPKLAYRGCMAVGSFEIDGPFVMGKAVDEAATHYEQADGAFVWLSPSAKAAWEAPEADTVSEAASWVLERWPVPLNGGARSDTYAVSLFGNAPEEKAAKFTRRMLSTFDRGESRNVLSVQIKRQNTESFLKASLERRLRPTAGT